MNAIERLHDFIAARLPLVWVVSHEEARVVALVTDEARSQGMSVVAWKATRGLSNAPRNNASASAPAFEEKPQRLGVCEHGGAEKSLLPHQLVTRENNPSSELCVLSASVVTPPPASLRDALFSIMDAPPGPLYLFLDAHAALTDSAAVRALRDFEAWLTRTKSVAVFVSPTRAIPADLARSFAILALPLPGEADLAALAPDAPPAVIRAARGLTLAEARRAFALARLRGLSADAVLDVKRQVLAAEEALSFIDPASEPGATLDDVGGLDELKRWLVERERAFGADARAFGLPEPKGLLLLGIQGCGKSLVAKAIAHLWRFPLLRLHLGAVFADRFGAEIRLRHATQVAEAVAPAVLWIDEIEKGLAGAGTGSTGEEAGVARTLGEFLTWLQEKTAPVFVVATANTVASLPPELLRKGRFDETFFIDLPAKADRARIFEIHIRRRGRNPADFAVDALADATENYSGAEIEQVVIAGLTRAFHAGRTLAGRTLTTTDLERAIDETVPLYATYEDDLKNLREWARKRARFATVNRSLLDYFQTTDVTGA